MKMKLRALLIAAFLFLYVNSVGVSAQAIQGYDPLAALPTSDVVSFANVQRILTEIVPRLLAKKPETLLKMATALNDVYTKTGVNLLSIDRVAVGVQFIGPAKLEAKKGNFGIAIIAHGDFDADKFIAFLKKETNNKGSEESYGGKTIHIEPRPNSARKPERETGALVFLDDHTVVLGDLPQVRATIDAASGKGRVDSSLVQLAMRDPNSLLGLAGNVPPELIKDIQDSPASDQTEEAIGKVLSGLKQVFASFGATLTEYDVTTGARMSSPEQAQSLSDLLSGIRQQMSANVDEEELREMIGAVQVTAQGDEVLLKANIPNSDVQDFVAMTMREEKPKVAAKTPAAPTEVKVVSKQATTTKRRRSKRRPRH